VFFQQAEILTMKKTILQIVVYCVCKAYICYEEKDSRCHSYDLPC